MRLTVSRTAVLLATLAWAAAGHSSAPPAEAFGALPAETDVVLSPDGHYLAWIDHGELAPRLVMFDLAARKTQRVVTFPARAKPRNLVWNDDETLLAVLSETVEAKVAVQRSREYFITVAYDVKGGEGRLLPTRSGSMQDMVWQVVSSALVRSSTSKAHTVIMSSTNTCNDGGNCLLEVDTTTGKHQIIKVGNELTTAWVVDRDGHPLAREDWDWRKSAYRVYALHGNNIKEILRRDDADRPLLAGILPDDSALVLLATNGRPHQAAWALPLDGSPPTLLAEDPDADITNTYIDAYTGAIVGVYAEGSKNSMRWLDAPSQHRYDMLQHAFPGRQVFVYGWTKDGSKTLARVEAPAMPPIYYLVDFTTHRADIAGEPYPALAGVQLGDFKEITYKARDGTPIPAYLTTPPGKGNTPGALVVLPHGGPNARDSPNFDWIVQFLAVRGYTVLQPQFRGSTGYGDAFREAGYRQWGGLMQDDVTDGVRAMIEQGIADPHRICIAGASYGGYAALAGAAFTPQLYRCAISVNGISDLHALLHEEVPEAVGLRIYSTSLSEWTARIGSPTDSNLANKSPINSIATISIPILLIYGSGDAIVPNAQSERMARALNAAGKPVTVVKLADEDHWLSRTETRVQMLKEFDTFLSQHLN